MTEPCSKDGLAVLLRLEQNGEVTILCASTKVYGGQAVWNGMTFHLRHLMRFYLQTNVICAAGYNHEPEK